MPSPPLGSVLVREYGERPTPEPGSHPARDGSGFPTAPTSQSTGGECPTPFAEGAAPKPGHPNRRRRQGFPPDAVPPDAQSSVEGAFFLRTKRTAAPPMTTSPMATPAMIGVAPEAPVAARFSSTAVPPAEAALG